ncbi:MAG: hypothetical protein QOF04_3716 [Solirubrobacteraceae bacterium]|jgi:hypothetical protein|nr:hypothetical protein [Solirubrobacteraceae bacterium]
MRSLPVRAILRVDPAESWGAPPGRTSSQDGEREMTRTLEGMVATGLPLERPAHRRGAATP